MDNKKTIYIDIDETICFNNGPKDEARDYAKATPNFENIAKANKLYDEGHTVIYWTARGALTKIDWTETTVLQLNKWGVKYHKVKLDKPHYDLMICDKVINTEDWE